MAQAVADRLETVPEQPQDFPGLESANRLDVVGEPGVHVKDPEHRVRIRSRRAKSIEEKLNGVALSVMRWRHVGEHHDSGWLSANHRRRGRGR